MGLFRSCRGIAFWDRLTTVGYRRVRRKPGIVNQSSKEAGERPGSGWPLPGCRRQTALFWGAPAPAAAGAPSGPARPVAAPPGSTCSPVRVPVQFGVQGSEESKFIFPPRRSCLLVSGPCTGPGLDHTGTSYVSRLPAGHQGSGRHLRLPQLLPRQRRGHAPHGFTVN